MLSLSEEPQIKGSLQCYSLVQGIARTPQAYMFFMMDVSAHTGYMYVSHNC